MQKPTESADSSSNLDILYRYVDNTPMDSLHKIMATAVVEMLSRNHHVAVAPGRDGALGEELSSMLEPALALLHNPAPAEPSRTGLRPSDVAGDLGVLERLAELLSQRLLKSDHLEDIFTDDQLLASDCLEVLRACLIDQLQREEPPAAEQTEALFSVSLESLGYLVRTVYPRLDPTRLHSALELAAEQMGGSLAEWRPADGVATFALAGGAAAGRLWIEEAIVELVGQFVDAKEVGLPSIEQLLEVSNQDCRGAVFENAIARAQARTRGLTGCSAVCRIVSDTTFVAILTPLSEEASRHRHEHFSLFLATIEQEIMVPSSSSSELLSDGPTVAVEGSHPPPQQTSPRTSETRARRGVSQPKNKRRRAK